MAEVNWYYSDGDKRLGPVSATQLKQLAASGVLASTDLVWKDGMEDWVAASTIDGLVPIAPPQSSSTPSDPPPQSTPPDFTATPSIAAQPRLPAPSSSGRRGPKSTVIAPNLTDLLGYARFICYPALVLGLLLAMMSRGCDQLSSRGIQAADAQAKLAVQKFDNKRAREQGKHASNSEAFAEAKEKLDEEEKKLKDGDWRDLQETADTAQLNHVIGAWWRELCFRFGTIMLTFGLLGVGLTSKGPDRWVCLVILVIVIMNLYGSVLTFGIGGR